MRYPLYSEKLINKLELLRNSLQNLEGDQGTLYQLMLEVMEEINEGQESFAATSWNYSDIRELLQDRDEPFDEQDIKEIAHSAEKRLLEQMTSEGWEVLDFFIDDHFVNKKTVNQSAN